jgi:hypothetical protein
MHHRTVLCLLSPFFLLSHLVAAQDERFTTDRKSEVSLPLAEEDDSFVFAVFGDRTGGPAEGVKVLAQAVEDVNLVDPDLLMTVGDLIEGYNQTERWQSQADEFSEIMNRLTSPWYPVAGNHDVYWRGDDRPEGEHEANYERHFGPLWYAFRHKDCWFITLYTDEGNPLTGERTFKKPASQRMSKAQFDFLDRTLERAKDARHVFLFLHHPRWRGGGYGEDWERVHQRLVAAGNVTAAFAGHIHHMVYDGARDGIEYFTLATVGGHQAGDAPEAGYLHHWNLVTVRDEGIAVATFPVGAALDPRLITNEVARAGRRMVDSVKPGFPQTPSLVSGQALEGAVQVSWKNPLERAIEINLSISCGDLRWNFSPDHEHLLVPAGEERLVEFEAWREAAEIDSAYQAPRLQYQLEYLAETHRVSLPSQSVVVPVRVKILPEPERPPEERAFDFDGHEDCLVVSHEQLALPDGPFTVECWFNADKFGNRTGLINKTESSEFGFFVSKGHPEFLLHVDGAYVTLEAPEVSLSTGRWYHIAAVFDGAEIRLYLDGELIASELASGARTIRNQPLLIGADTDRNGRGNSFFDGRLDEVHVSVEPRYSEDQFTPERRLDPDESTILLLHLDQRVGDWVYDSSPGSNHPRVRGLPRAVGVE